MRGEKQEEQKGARRERGMWDKGTRGQGDKGIRDFRLLVPLSPCPLVSRSPFPLCFLLFTQIDRVIEGNRYVFSSPAGDHRLFSDHRNLDSTIAKEAMIAGGRREYIAISLN